MEICPPEDLHLQGLQQPAVTAQQWAQGTTDGGTPWYSPEEMKWTQRFFVLFQAKSRLKRAILLVAAVSQQEPSGEPCRKLAVASKLWFGTHPLQDLCQIFRFLFSGFFFLFLFMLAFYLTVPHEFKAISLVYFVTRMGYFVWSSLMEGKNTRCM